MNDHPVRVEEALKACPMCRCHEVVRVDALQSGGHFAPGPELRCANCKHVFLARPHPIEAQGSEETASNREAVEAFVQQAGQSFYSARSDDEWTQDKNNIVDAILVLTRPDPSLGGREVERERLKADPVEMLAEALYNICPCGEQPTDPDGRPLGPGGVVYWSQMDDYDPKEAEKIREQARVLADPDALSPPFLGMEGVRESLVKERARWDRQSEIWEHAIRKGNAPVRSGIHMRHADEVVLMLDRLIASISTPGEVG